jgi:hypothetical protein
LELKEYNKYKAELAYKEVYNTDPEDINNQSLNLWRGTVIKNNLTPPGYILIVIERKLEPKRL